MLGSVVVCEDSGAEGRTRQGGGGTWSTNVEQSARRKVDGSARLGTAAVSRSTTALRATEASIFGTGKEDFLTRKKTR